MKDTPPVATGDPVRNWIDGNWQPASDGRAGPVVNPSTGEVVATVAISSRSDVDRAVAAARRAGQTWAARSPATRSRALLALADRLEEHAAELTELEITDVGKPVSAAAAEIPFIADNLRQFAAAARTMSAPAPDYYAPDGLSLLVREPMGVVGQVTGWNYPLMMAAWKIGPAVAAGNTLVLKPSELTPLSTSRLAELTADIFPPGVVNVVHGTGAEAGEALIGHDQVAMVSVTGSVATGRRVAAQAARTLKRTHLELGGKAPAVVFADSDLPTVAQNVLRAGFTNAGQDCTALTRIVCDARALDELREHLRIELQALQVGNPHDPSTDVGPLVSAAHRDRVADALARAQSGDWLLTASAPHGPGFWAAPTIAGGIAADDPLHTEEVFGPLVTVQTFATEQQAVALANRSPYGLVASVWTSDISRALRLTRQLSYGTVWVNQHQLLVSEMPHGGRRDSGYGSDMSVLAVSEYTQPKHIMLATATEATR